MSPPHASDMADTPTGTRFIPLQSFILSTSRCNEATSITKTAEPQYAVTSSAPTTEVPPNPMFHEATDLSLTTGTNKCQDLLLEYLRQRDLTSPVPPTYTAIHLAADYISRLLNAKDVAFYFHGGFAILKLSSANRQTADLDMVVKNGADGYGVFLDLIDTEAAIVQNKEVSDDIFVIVQNGLTMEAVPVDVQPSGWGGTFPDILEETTVVQNGLKFLAPDYILKAKIGCLGNEDRYSRKGGNDMIDALALYDTCVKENRIPVFGMQD
jgi:hypothetical protein